MDFKVGDKVRVKDLTEGIRYGKYRAIVGMLEYRGKIFKIRKTTPAGNINLYDVPYYWTPEMLELISTTSTKYIEDLAKINIDISF